MDIQNASIADLQAEITRRKKATRDIGKMVRTINETIGSPVGAWLITTEGDCEGRTTQTLGVEQGHILDLARKYGRMAMYGLKFKRQANIPEEKGVLPTDTVHIQLDINSGTWDMKDADRACAIAAWAKQEQPQYQGLIPVTESNYYASVKVDFS